MYLHASYLTFFGSRNLEIVNLITPMDGRGKILAAVLNPLDSMTCFHGGESRNHLFGIDIEFGAKAATDFWYNHSYLVLRQTNESSQDITQEVRNLRGTPDGQIFTCLPVLRYDTACLHRDWGKSLVNQAGFGNDTAIGLCLSENFVNFIGRGMHAEGHICAELFIQERRIGPHSFLDINSRGQGFIINFNQVARITSRITVISDNYGHRITIETYFAISQCTSIAHTLGNFSQGDGNGDVTNNTFEVFSCIDRYYTWMLPRCASINTSNARMTIRATQNRHVEHARDFDLINIGSLTCNQARIFTSLYGRTKHSCNTHCLPVLSHARNSKKWEEM